MANVSEYQAAPIDETGEVADPRALLMEEGTDVNRVDMAPSQMPSLDRYGLSKLPLGRLLGIVAVGAVMATVFWQHTTVTESDVKNSQEKYGLGSLGDLDFGEIQGKAKGALEMVNEVGNKNLGPLAEKAKMEIENAKALRAKAREVAASFGTNDKKKEEEVNNMRQEAEEDAQEAERESEEVEEQVEMPPSEKRKIEEEARQAEDEAEVEALESENDPKKDEEALDGAIAESNEIEKTEASLDKIKKDGTGQFEMLKGKKLRVAHGLEEKLEKEEKTEETYLKEVKDKLGGPLVERQVDVDAQAQEADAAEKSIEEVIDQLPETKTKQVEKPLGEAVKKAKEVNTKRAEVKDEIKKLKKEMAKAKKDKRAKKAAKKAKKDKRAKKAARKARKHKIMKEREKIAEMEDEITDEEEAVEDLDDKAEAVIEKFDPKRGEELQEDELDAEDEEEEEEEEEEKESED